jgi:hypothetical protein
MSALLIVWTRPLVERLDDPSKYVALFAAVLVQGTTLDP